MPDRYTRFGEFFMRGLARTLAEGTPIDVPHVGVCKVRSVVEPRMHHSNWSMQVSISFPDSHSEMTIGMYTFGSCLLPDTEAIKLPAPSYVDENDTLFPKEHEEAWFRLLGAVERELEALGYRLGSDDDSDFYLITDYMPSNGISVSALKPAVLTPDVLDLCQRLARTEAQWDLWIRLAFEFTDKRSTGHAENILVRPDRIVHDYDPVRLFNELGADTPIVVRRGSG
ncbi:hypothetical protein [uncultured Methylibium sp.]|uniref:hypothetical protein n=1 Tax=uncultured Methylibium sp. TaxID=381093 RepID=UPI0025F0B9CE|nr:hypothetical protein [uncultured Methylibium sp.]